MSSPRPTLRASALAGALLGLAAFAVEAALIARDNPLGLDLDVKGPFAALMEAVRPHVPWLLARVGAGYLVAGSLGGLFVGALTRLLALRRWWSAWPAYLLNYAALVALLVIDRSVARPALFDDLGWYRPALAWLVDHGDVSSIRALAAALFVGQLLVASWRRRLWKAHVIRQAQVALVALVLAVVGTQLWANTLPTGATAHPREGARASASAPEASAQADGRAPLVVLIGIDAFRMDRLQRSPAVAPHVEHFLEEATLFTNAWTPIAQTEPAWRSLISARWPHRTGLRYPLTAESRWLPAPTFTSALAAQGWTTTFATDCSRFNYQTAGSGFTETRQPPRGAINFVLEKMRFRLLGVFADNDLGAAAFPELIGNRALAGLYEPAGYAERLAQEIAERAESGPTFYAFHATAAHFPGDPTFPYYRHFVRADAPLDRRVRMFFSPIAKGNVAHADGWGRAESESLYDELLSQADAQVGVILDELRDRGLYDEATIILFSDHGESFHEDHPELGGSTPVHGARLSREENQILLAVKLPASMRKPETPRQSEALVRLIDIAPTILDVAGVSPLEGADGVSLRPLLEGRTAPAQQLYAETGMTHASPAAFDPDHLAVAPRTFDIYRIRRDGVVELNDDAHAAAIREKDLGAFDGKSWIIRAPRADGSIAERCTGECPATALSAWLDATLGRHELARGARTESVPQ